MTRTAPVRSRPSHDIAKGPSMGRCADLRDGAPASPGTPRKAALVFCITRTPPLFTAARPRGGDWLTDDLSAWQAAGVSHVVSLLTAREAVALGLGHAQARCRAAGLGYTHLPIPDRAVPGSTGAFHAGLTPARRTLAAGRGVLTHCRQGIGRASLAAGALLVEAGAAPAAAWARIERARGCVVPDTLEQRRWLAAYAGWIRLRRLWPTSCG